MEMGANSDQERWAAWTGAPTTITSGGRHGQGRQRSRGAGGMVDRGANSDHEGRAAWWTGAPTAITRGGRHGGQGRQQRSRGVGGMVDRGANSDPGPFVSVDGPRLSGDGRRMTDEQTAPRAFRNFILFRFYDRFWPSLGNIIRPSNRTFDYVTLLTTFERGESIARAMVARVRVRPRARPPPTSRPAVEWVLAVGDIAPFTPPSSSTESNPTESR